MKTSARAFRVFILASLASGFLGFLAVAGIVSDVRSAVAGGDFARAESEIHDYRAARGVTPEMIEALSWMGRGALAARQFEKAGQYARETHKLAVEELKKRSLDAEPHLPLALGAAIEVEAQAMAASGERAGAVAFLETELPAYKNTSLAARIHKNLNLLSLEGKPAPPLAGISLQQYRGRPVLLFFWAHWCPDCKWEVPVLARLEEQYGKRLVLIGPTQHYGYVAGGEPASSDQELRYIEEVRKRYYAPLTGMPTPVSEENFKSYGASTVPTLVLLDSHGIVRMYHPGRMSYEELNAAIEKLLNPHSSILTPALTAPLSVPDTAGLGIPLPRGVSRCRDTC